MLIKNYTIGQMLREVICDPKGIYPSRNKHMLVLGSRLDWAGKTVYTCLVIETGRKNDYYLQSDKVVFYEEI